MTDDLGQILGLVVGILVAVAALLGAAGFMERWMSRPVTVRAGVGAGVGAGPAATGDDRDDAPGAAGWDVVASASSPEPQPASARTGPRHARKQ